MRDSHNRYWPLPAVRSAGALALATRVGYAHPDGIPVLGAESQLPVGPWLQHLENGWVRVRTCWREPLREVLGRPAGPGRDTLHQAAGWLLQAGADDQAISLYIEIGDPDCAARIIASCATVLMDRGQWATLERWLRQLPDDVLASHPDLIYCQADIAAACGHAEVAQRWFDIAASHCSKRNDIEGACHSMLAASAVAAGHGDLAAALSHACVVGTLAEDSDLTTVRMWASWQQGRIQLMSGDTDGALASFCRAASAEIPPRDDTAMQPVQVAGNLATRVRELRCQQESHRAAEAALKQAEHEALNQLLADVRTPAWDSDNVLGTLGWSRAPAPLKLPGLSTPGIVAPARRAWPWARFRRPMQGTRQTGATPRIRPADPGSHSAAPRPPRSRIGPPSWTCPLPGTRPVSSVRLPSADHLPRSGRHRRHSGPTRRPGSPYICSGHSAWPLMTCQSGIGPALVAARCSGTC